MNRAYNFSPGPAMLPTEVLQQVQEELLDYNNTGMSIMEMSHRGGIFEKSTMILWHYCEKLRTFPIDLISFI